MNTIRCGKIARLPEAIREQVNERLANHEPGGTLLAWLNALPEVREVLAREFGGREIDKFNLHRWRQRGHAEWRRREEARKLMERLGTDGNGLAKMDAGAVLNMMTTFAAARYAVAMKRMEGKEGPSWERLREFCQDLVALQRGEHRAQRRKYESEKEGQGRMQSGEGAFWESGNEPEHSTLNIQRPTSKGFLRERREF